jgi:hypothetical protein
LGDQAAREAHFCEAVAIAPKYDLASSGLFFALFAQDRLGDALRELVRYLRLKYSQLYAEMLIVGFEIGFSDEHAKLVDEARQLLAKYRRN